MGDEVSEGEDVIVRHFLRGVVGRSRVLSDRDGGRTGLETCRDRKSRQSSLVASDGNATAAPRRCQRHVEDVNESSFQRCL